MIFTKHGRPVAAVVAADPDALEDFVLTTAPEYAAARRAGDVVLASGRALPALAGFDQICRRASARRVDRILLSTRAARDLRRLGPGTELDRFQAGLERLSHDKPNLDIKPVADCTPRRRLRIADWRILHRPAGDQILMARIVHRSEPRQAIRTLD
jgi:antitoxin (DNA-binding transcriptional repressor) of toxin-antitoxin stability system